MATAVAPPTILEPKDPDSTTITMLSLDEMNEKKIITGINQLLFEYKNYLLSCEDFYVTKIQALLQQLKEFILKLDPLNSLAKIISTFLSKEPISRSSQHFLFSAMNDEEIEDLLLEEKSPGIVLIFGILISFFLLAAQKASSSQDKAHRRASLFTLKLMKFSLSINNRELDFLSAKIIYLNSLAFERAGLVEPLLRNLLLYFRSSCVRNDEICQAQAINSILRCYVLMNDFEQAAAFASRVTFPESANNNQHARQLYYLVRGSYQVAGELLNECIRRGPQSPTAGVGFQQSVQKLLVLVLLLAGEVPRRSIFEKSSIFEVALHPYFSLVQAVRKGDVSLFEEVVSKNQASYEKDKTIDLVLRLRNCVIRAGLRLVSLCYSRISLQEIARKLHISPDSEIESIINQAIADTIISGHIEKGVLVTEPAADLYATDEPQRAFSSRSSFCMKMRIAAQNGLRYPQESYAEGLVSPSNNANKENSTDGKNSSPHSKTQSSSENEDEEDDMLLLNGEEDDCFDGDDFL